MIEALRKVRHDLGKYVCFQLRWLPGDAGDEELLEALRADVLATRRGPSGTESAVAIWARLRPSVEGLDLALVDAHVALLESHLEGLQAGTLEPDELQACAAAARGISAELTRLHEGLKEA